MSENPDAGHDAATDQAATNQPPASPEDIRRLGTLLFDHVEGQIARADTKAELLLAANAILLAITLTMLKGAATTLSSNASAQSPDIIALFGAAFGLGSFAALLLAFFTALLIVRPRLKAPDNARLMFFGHIATLSEGGFADEFSVQTSAQAQRAVLDEVHAKAIIAKAKYTGVSISVAFLMLALLLLGGQGIALALSGSSSAGQTVSQPSPTPAVSSP